MEVSDSTKTMQKRILKDAEDEAQRVKSEAKEKAEKIVKEAKQRAKEMKEEEIEKVKKHMDETQRQDVAEKKADYHRRMQSLKSELIDEAFDKLKEELQKYVKKIAYQKTLNSLITEAGIVLGGGKLIITLNEKDKQKISKETIKKIRKQIQKETNMETSIDLDEKIIQTIGGAAISMVDQKATIDNTFEARLERIKEKTKAELEAILFE